MGFFGILYRGVNYFIGVLVILTISFMIFDVNLGVFFRYVLNDALCWTEELARYLMVWFAFFGMSFALRDNQHVGVIFILQRLPPGARRIVQFLNRVIVMIFLVFLFKYSLNHLKVVSVQLSPSMEIPMYLAYSAVTVGTLLMMLENLKHMVSELRRGY